VDVASEYRLNPVSSDLREIRVVNAGSSQGVTWLWRTLVGADVYPGGFLGRPPEVAIEVALAPHAAGRVVKELIIAIC